MSWFNLNNTTPIQPHQEGTAASSKLHLFGGRGVSYFQHTRSSTIWRRPLWLWRSCGGWFRTTRWIVVVSRVTCVSGLSEFFSGCWKMIIWREICLPMLASDCYSKAMVVWTWAVWGWRWNWRHELNLGFPWFSKNERETEWRHTWS